MSTTDVSDSCDFEIALDSVGLVRCKRPVLRTELELLKTIQDGASADTLVRTLIRLIAIADSPDCVDKNQGSVQKFDAGQIPEDELEQFANGFLERSRFMQVAKRETVQSDLPECSSESSRRKLAQLLKATLENRASRLKQSAGSAVSQLAAKATHLTRYGNSLTQMLQTQERLRAQFASASFPHLKVASDALRASQFASAALAIAQTPNIGLTTNQLAQNIARMSELTGILSLQFDRASSAIFKGSSVVPLELEGVFRRARADELTGFASMIERIQTSNETLSSFALSSVAATKLLGELNAPWVKTGHELRSLQGIMDLAGIGRALHVLKPFDAGLTDAMRMTLGDWRNVTIPANIYDSTANRVNFYAALGLDRSLTEFPPATLERALDLSRISERFPRSNRNRTAVRSEVSGRSVRFTPRWMTRAYEIIFAFESEIRKFINHEMTLAFGTEWIKHQLSGNLLQQWQERREGDAKQGASTSILIDYADFSDYERIICRDDNWKKVFQQFFPRKESVRESFLRLTVVRRITMHSRLLTGEDLLYLRVEVSRLRKAIKAKRG